MSCTRALACVCVFDREVSYLGLPYSFLSKAIEIGLYLNIREDLQFAEIIKHVSLCSVSTEKQKSAPAKQNTAANSNSRNHSATVIPLCPRPHGSLAAGWRSSGADRAPHAPPSAPVVPSGRVLGAGPAPLLPVRCPAPRHRGLAVPLACGGRGVPHTHALVLGTFIP